MVFNATVTNISAISRQSFLSVEETGVPGEKHHKLLTNFKCYINLKLSHTVSLIICLPYTQRNFFLIHVFGTQEHQHIRLFAVSVKFKFCFISIFKSAIISNCFNVLIDWYLTISSAVFQLYLC